VKFTAGGSRNVELFVPFVGIRDKIHTDYPAPGGVGIQNMHGSFHLQVFNPLQVGVDATQDTATIAIFVSFPKTSFEVIKFGAGGTQWDRQLSQVHRKWKQVSFVVVEEEKETKDRKIHVKMKRDPLESEWKATHRGLKSQVQGGVLSTAAGVLSIANDTVDFAHKLGRKGKALRGGDLDYPNVGANATPVMQIGTVDIANGTSQAALCRYMDIAPSRGDILTHLDIATSDDEMDIKELAMKPTFWKTFTWNATDAEGTKIFSGDLTIAPDILLSVPEVEFQPTLMEYVMLPFSFWRATLVYTFEVISTQYHSGRLAFLPRIGGTADAADIADAFDQYGGTMDISGKNLTFQFRVKYEAGTKMLYVPHDSTLGTELRYLLLSMGRFGVYIVNPLQFGGVSESVQINVYLSAEDLTYDMPGQGLTGITVVNPYVA